MGAAVAVSAHFLEQLQTVALNALGHRLAGQAVILMAANALNLHRAVIQEEALVLVKTDGAEAEAVALALYHFLPQRDHGFQRIEVRAVDVPKGRIRHLAPLMEGRFFPGGNFDGAFQCKDLLSGGVFSHRTHHCHRRLVAVVAQRGIHRHVPPAFGLALRMDEHAVKIHRHRLGLDQPHRAVNARALVPPALMLAGVDMDGNDVFLPEIHHVGHVYLKGIVAAVVGEHIAAVDVYLAMNAHALKIQADAAAFVGGVQREVLAVPRIFIAEEAQRIVVFFLGLLTDDVVMGHIHGQPGLVGDQVRLVIEFRAVHIFPGSGAAALAGRLGFDIHGRLQLGFLHRNVAQMEAPVLIERKGFLHLLFSSSFGEFAQTVPQERTEYKTAFFDGRVAKFEPDGRKAFPALFSPGQPMKHPIGQLEDHHNAQHDGQRILQGGKAVLLRQRQLIGHGIVGRPVDAGSGHQRKNARNQKNRHRALLPHGKHAAEQNHAQRSKKDGFGLRGGKPLRQKSIDQPAGPAYEAAVEIKFARHAKEQRKGHRAHGRRQNLRNHRIAPPQSR